MNVHAFPDRHHGKPFRALQQFQWSEALRSLRDLRCVKAIGEAANRFEALRDIGLAYQDNDRGLWRLTDQGAERVAELFPVYRTEGEGA